VLLSAGAQDIYVAVFVENSGWSNILKIEAAAYVSPPPVLSAGSVNRTSNTAATITFTSDRTGDVLYLAVAKGAPAPTIDDIDANGVALDAVTVGVNTKAVLLSAGAQDIYVAVFVENSGWSNILKIEAAAYVP